MYYAQVFLALLVAVLPSAVVYGWTISEQIGIAAIGAFATLTVALMNAYFARQARNLARKVYDDVPGQVEETIHAIHSVKDDVRDLKADSNEVRIDVRAVRQELRDVKRNTRENKQGLDEHLQKAELIQSEVMVAIDKVDKKIDRIEAKVDDSNGGVSNGSSSS